MPAVASNVVLHDVNEDIQFLGRLGKVLLRFALVASQSHTGSRELSHDTIILSYESAILSQPTLKTVQALFRLNEALLRLRKALAGLGELGVKSRVHARLIFEQEINGPFDVHANLPFCAN